MDSSEKSGSMQSSARGLLANFLSVLMILVDSHIFVIFQGCSKDFHLWEPFLPHLVTRDNDCPYAQSAFEVYC